MIQIDKQRMVALGTSQLRKLCDQAAECGFDHVPSDQFWLNVDQSGLHVVFAAFIHTPDLDFWAHAKHNYNFSHGDGKNIRALVLCKMLDTMIPQHMLCDFDYDTYMQLVVTQQERN